MKHCIRTIALLLLLTLCGCTNSALWKNHALSRFHEPGNPSQVAIHQSADARRVLIEYNEICEESEHKERRAYWLALGETSKPNPHRPVFVSCDTAQGLPSVPLIEPQDGAAISCTGLCAVVSTNGREFTIYSDGRDVGHYRLPVYEDSSGRLKRIALTPLTVAADATIVGGLIGLWLWSEGGLSDVH